MGLCRKTILLLIFSSFMSVGWGQSEMDNYTQEIINISDEEIMIISNYEMEGYTFSDTTYVSVSRLFPPCDDGYTEIDSSCYYQSDLDVLQQFINNSSETINMEMDIDSSGVIEPLELGSQYWNEGRITYLSCNDLGLSGDIPQNIGNLISLTYLSLQSNQLTGEIPGSIVNLVILTHLNLFNNNLTGEIPSNIGNLTNLTFLSLSNNDLNGGIPESIGNLTNVWYFDIFGNNINGQIPESIGGMSNVSVLYLYHNQLTGEIPQSIGNLLNLTHIIFFNNDLNGEIPESIGNLTNLSYLRLDNNELSGEIPDSMCNLNVNWGEDNGSGGVYGEVYNNQLCPPYPSCIEDYVGYQDTSECVECILGDYNGDSELDILDVTSIVNFILEGQGSNYDECSDINEDGYLNILDVMSLVYTILN